MSILEEVLGLTQSITTTESRLLLSIVLVLLAFGAGFFVVPRLAQLGARSFRQRVEQTEAESAVEQLDDFLDWRPVITIVLRTLQSLIVVAAGISLLLIWGYDNSALAAVTLLTASVPYVARILLTVGLLALAIVGARYIETRIEDWAADSTYVTRHQEGVAFRVLQLTIFIAVGMAALSLWQVDLSGLVISAGFLGIVVGMASRKTLGSLVAGFVLMFSRPFEIGDWVEIDDNDGIVTDITIVNTRLRNLDGETVVLPNDRVASETVINRSKRNRLRIRTTVGVDYGTELDRAEAVIHEAIESVDPVSPAPKPEVLPTKFSDSAILLECRFWIKNPNARKKWQTQAAAIRAIKDAFDTANITIPFPQRELSERSEEDRSSENGRQPDADKSENLFPDKQPFSSRSASNTSGRE